MAGSTSWFDATEPGFEVRVTADRAGQDGKIIRGRWVFVFQYRLGSTVHRHRIDVWGKGFC